MKILEIKNNLIKIEYSVLENLILSGFLLIEDEHIPYVGQIVSLGASEGTNYAMAKILFTFSDDGFLKDYSGSIPAMNSAISKLNSNELLDVLPMQTPVIFGRLAQQDFTLKLDKAIFEDNLVICSNKYEDTDVLILNFAKQFEKQEQKTVIFDTDGEFSHPGMLTLGDDFKIPLDYDAIDFIFHNDLEDVDAISKSLIQDIFVELQEYVQNTPEKFIPFDSFLGIVEQQYKETGIVELLLLKNKLLKYKNSNVFAQNLEDILSVNTRLENAYVVIIDISRAEPKLQREIIFHVYDVMESMNCDIYSFVKINNENSNKKLLKRFFDKINVFTIPVCTHEYRYLPELKQWADNMIVFAPLASKPDFAGYNTFLNKLNIDEFIVFGTYTQNITLIVQLDKDMNEINLDDFSPDIDEEPEEIPALSVVSPAAASEEPAPAPEPAPQTVTAMPAAMQPAPAVLPQAEPEIQPVVPLVIPPSPPPAIEQVVFAPEPEPAIMAVAAPQPAQMTFSPAEPEIMSQLIMPVEPILNDSLEFQTLPDLSPLIIEEEPLIIEEDDYENIIIEDESLVEEVQSVPVYPADDIDYRNAPVFEQGDSVSHPKYGPGVVEKMIKYGSKTLVSISFEGIGRRLLDPAISEITKLS